MLAHLNRSLTNQSEKVDQSMTKRGTYGLLMQIANCCIMVEGIVPHFVSTVICKLWHPVMDSWMNVFH